MRMQSRYKTKTIILWSVILTGLVFLTAVLTSEMSYLTNDDGGIQSALSGFFTGEPYPFHQFISVILSFPISALYNIFPEIQWWYVWSLVAMAIGIFLVQYCLLRIALNGNYPIVIVFGILVFIDIGIFIYPVANVSFTIVPAILGTGIVVGILWLADSNSIKHKRLLFAGIIIGYILLLSHRRQTGLALLCYILLAFFYYYVSKSEKLSNAIIKFIGTTAFFLIITILLTTLNSTIQERHNGEEFVTFNSARSQFIDYPHDTYEENPELYETVGWDEDTYNLATKWCFLNENVTAESLSYISENSEYTTASTSIITLLKQIYHDQRCFAIFMLYAISFIFAGFVIFLYVDKKSLLLFILNNIGTGLLILYQLLSGRAMYRSIVIIILPAVIINIMIGLKKKPKAVSLKILYIGLTLMGLICLIPVLSATFDADRNNAVSETIEKYNNVDKYLADHQNDFYIKETTGISDNIDPRNITSRVSNCISWGSSSQYSAIFYEQLKLNGFSELTENTFKQQHVHFLSNTNVLSEYYHDTGDDLFAMLYRKLQEDCDALGFVFEDAICDGAYVYSFVFEENLYEYDVYYDIVDGYTMKVCNIP